MAEAVAAEPTVTFLSDDLAHVVWILPERPSGRQDIGRPARALAECALSEAILLRGGGFARHVRTTLSEEGGISRADAVYTVSPTLPAGPFAIDAEAVASSCRDLATKGA